MAGEPEFYKAARHPVLDAGYKVRRARTAPHTHTRKKGWQGRRARRAGAGGPRAACRPPPLRGGQTGRARGGDSPRQRARASRAATPEKTRATPPKETKTRR